MANRAPVTLELDDIQSGTLHPRPTPYVGRYILIRIDDRRAGREMLRRLHPFVASATNWSAGSATWLTVALTFQGLKALGAPQGSLDSFSPEFQQGLAARAAELGDYGENSPANWENPLGTPDVHAALSTIAPDAARLAVVLEQARAASRDLAGVSVIFTQDFYQLPSEREHFGFKDGISQPVIEGSGNPGHPGHGPPIKAGEFILGYPDQTGSLPPMPQPDVLGRNGSYVVFQKLHTRVAAFRQYLRANSTNPEEEELLAAKMMGRWRSGAPLSLSSERDDPALGADPKRNNDFRFFEDDYKGIRCPVSSHIRRMNPRDGLKDTATVVELHRLLRRGTTYGPALPEGVMEDDGADRGIVFVFSGAHLKRQYEFVKSQWANEGNFVGLGAEQDAFVRTDDGPGMFTLPKQPIRRRLQGLPQFVVNRGGEYAFAPGLRALRWLAELDT